MLSLDMMTQKILKRKRNKETNKQTNNIFFFFNYNQLNKKSPGTTLVVVNLDDAYKGVERGRSRECSSRQVDWNIQGRHSQMKESWKMFFKFSQAFSVSGSICIEPDVLSIPTFPKDEFEIFLIGVLSFDPVLLSSSASAR